MQKDLFGEDDEKPQPAKSLAIIKQGRQELNKKQKEFNRLVQKIEKLRGNLTKTSDTLNKQLDYYVAHIDPLEKKVTMLRTASVKILYTYYTGEKKAISKKDKMILRDLLADYLDEIFSLTEQEPDEELKAIFKNISGMSFDKLKEYQFAEMKDMMEDQFRSQGFDIDLDDIDADMDGEEIARKLKEKQAEFARQAEAQDEKKLGEKKRRSNRRRKTGRRK